VTPPPTPSRPLAVILSGPSGAGKDAVLARMHERGLPIAVPVTMTTRAPRDGEVDGVNHHFVTREEFLRRLQAGALLEHAEVYGNLYGVPRSEVRKALASGRHTIIRVDVQGAASLREALPGALSLFLVPEDLKRLETRLRARGSENADDLRRRLGIAEREMAEADEFDEVVVNVEGDLDTAVDTAWAIIEREAARADRKPVEV
jgi:guanylate kinase